MNENLNLCEILKDCPIETKFWTSLWGSVYFSGIKEGMVCINVPMSGQEIEEFFILKDGRFYDFEDAECIIFPSKEQRDWSKFKTPVKRFNPEEFKPFDKVLLRDGKEINWIPGFFEKLLKQSNGDCSVVDFRRYSWYMCIPYNDETKCLLGTREDCPEYYKWWEE